jgi:glycosyltransferase involved in cell wall biosynthesis
VKNIAFCGHVKNEDIYSYLAKSDIFISSPIIDNQPMSILEAFATGLLVISSNVGGVPYMVNNGKTGLLFESNNYIELSEKMLWAVEHPKESLKIIKEANKSLSYYSWDNVKQKLLHLYSLENYEFNN